MPNFFLRHPEKFFGMPKSFSASRKGLNLFGWHPGISNMALYSNLVIFCGIPKREPSFVTRSTMCDCTNTAPTQHEHDSLRHADKCSANIRKTCLSEQNYACNDSQPNWLGWGSFSDLVFCLIQF